MKEIRLTTAKKEDIFKKVSSFGLTVTKAKVISEIFSVLIEEELTKKGNLKKDGFR